MTKKYKYYVDYDLHPQYRGYWVVRIPLQQPTPFSLVRIPARHRAVRWARKHQAFYDTDRMVPDTLF